MGGGIDLAAVQLTTLRRTERIRVTFGLHSRAMGGSLEQPGGMRVAFIRNKRIWRVVEVATDGGVLRGEICSGSRGPELIEPYDCSSLPVTQVDGTTYRALVKRKQVKKGATVLKWTAGRLRLYSNRCTMVRSTPVRNGSRLRRRGAGGRDSHP